MAVARNSSDSARLPSKASRRTTRGGSCPRAGTAAARSNASAPAARPLTGAPGPGVEGRRGVAARLTACSKPGSLTTLRSQVNVRPALHPSTGIPIRQIRLRLLPCLLLAIAACAVGGEASGRGLTYYEGADPASLDPALSNDVQSGEVMTLLFDNLVQFDTEARLQPGLATRWESDSTGAVYSFHLRTGA